MNCLFAVCIFAGLLVGEIHATNSVAETTTEAPTTTESPEDVAIIAWVDVEDIDAAPTFHDGENFVQLIGDYDECNDAETAAFTGTTDRILQDPNDVNSYAAEVLCGESEVYVLYTAEGEGASTVNMVTADLGMEGIDQGIMKGFNTEVDSASTLTAGVVVAFCVMYSLIL